MSETVQQVPRGVLIAAAAMIALTIGVAWTARWTGLGRVSMPEAKSSRVLELRFEDRNDGSISIYNASNDRLVEVLNSGTSGFVRVVMRSLVRERRTNEVYRQTPFRLIRWADGRLSVEDPTTGRSIDLGAFGAPNTEAFAQIMTAGETTQ